VNGLGVLGLVFCLRGAGGRGGVSGRQRGELLIRSLIAEVHLGGFEGVGTAAFRGFVVRKKGCRCESSPGFVRGIQKKEGI